MKVSKQRRFSGYFNAFLCAVDIGAAVYTGHYALWLTIAALTGFISWASLSSAKVLEQKGR